MSALPSPAARVVRVPAAFFKQITQIDHGAVVARCYGSAQPFLSLRLIALVDCARGQLPHRICTAVLGLLLEHELGCRTR